MPTLSKNKGEELMIGLNLERGDIWIYAGILKFWGLILLTLQGYFKL